MLATDRKRSMAMPQKGDTVQIHYNGFLEDGTIFEYTISGEPFLFIIGEGRIISGIENAILEMD